MIADLDTLWRTYHREMFAHLYNHVRDGQEAEELVSCVYLRAVVAIRNGNGPSVNERGWLYAIARSVLADEWRAHQRRATCDCLDNYAEQPGDHVVDDTVIRKVTSDHVRLAVSRLSYMQQTVTEMRLDGYGNTEISEAHELSVGAVKALGNRANANLRMHLQGLS